MFGILLVHKHLGCSSHDVVNDVRRKFGTRRVGHAGTLDPQASGLLVVAVGPATRFLQYLPLEPKEYHAQVRFGRATSTYDSEGEAIGGSEPPENLREAIEMALPRFRGSIEQLPPMYSAVKVAGKPLYKYARQGQELERKPRRVHIDTFEVMGGEVHEFEFRIVCSGGTYIRSLAHDLGSVLGCGAYLAGLQRVAVGRFHLDHSAPLGEIDPSQLIPLSEALPPMPLIYVTEAQVGEVREGRSIKLETPDGASVVALVGSSGDVFCVARVVGDLVHPECVIPSEVTLGAG